MKNIFRITFVLFFGSLTMTCKAQITYPKDGDNILNPNLNKFIGVWNWSNGTEILQLVLKKENVKLPIGNNIKADVLYGFHRYVKNNIEIENSLQYSSTTYLDNKQTVSGLGDINVSNKIGGGIIHISKNRKRVRYEIEYIDATHIKLVSLKNPEGIRINIAGQPSYDSSISLPQNIILTKQ